MKDTTKKIIELAINNDDTVSPEMKAGILRAMRQPVQKRKLINGKQAAELLEVSRATLRDYVRKGLLEQITMSSRKIRFDEEEVARLAYSGVSTGVNTVKKEQTN